MVKLALLSVCPDMCWIWNRYNILNLSVKVYVFRQKQSHRISSASFVNLRFFVANIFLFFWRFSESWVMRERTNRIFWEAQYFKTYLHQIYSMQICLKILCRIQILTTHIMFCTFYLAAVDKDFNPKPLKLIYNFTT